MITSVFFGMGSLACIGFFFWLFQKGKASAMARYLEEENHKLEQIYEERNRLVKQHEEKERDKASGNDDSDPSTYWL